MTTVTDAERDLARSRLRERQAAELADLRDRQRTEREAEGLPLAPIATWNAFSPAELIGVVAGVTRMDPASAEATVRGLLHGEPATTTHEFDTERRDPFTGPTAAGHAGALIGGARWRIERADISDWKLHLLAAEPCGVA
jgi:hypothetical protein